MEPPHARISLFYCSANDSLLLYEVIILPQGLFLYEQRKGRKKLVNTSFACHGVDSVIVFLLVAVVRDGCPRNQQCKWSRPRCGRLTCSFCLLRCFCKCDSCSSAEALSYRPMVKNKVYPAILLSFCKTFLQPGHQTLLLCSRLCLPKHELLALSR